MKLLSLCSAICFAADLVAGTSAPAIRSGIKKRGIATPKAIRQRSTAACSSIVKPKFFIISMFSSEADIWYADTELNLYAKNITVPGFSPLFPDAHCTESGDVCQLTTGEGEINAASTLSALWTSGCFDLASTYFMIAGISGGNPYHVTTGSVTFSKYAVQLNLQYEFDHSQTPANASSGYYPQDASYPDEYSARDYPGEIYGTEAFELNENLRDHLYDIASSVTLNDTTAAAVYRAKYTISPGNEPPSVVKCDSGTSDNYWSGSVLADAFTNYTLLLTNGSGVYCGTQQEDNATLEALLRGALAGKLDFARIIIMRTISDFDRAPPGETETYHLIEAEQGGFTPSVNNIYIAGIEIVHDVLRNWNSTYAGGIKPENYVGDLWNSLNSEVAPDIGTEAIYIN
ncbi:hypothetical protein FKW77_000591 [Venturia effusa]|uniref:Purine nucleoside permease n=1 Tax=Venturia effusa TaxID=50376 RepID=A0A517L2L7_9PEZI|nr:hypothetical protein FKW77_000591 [Venturia effusa]